MTATDDLDRRIAEHFEREAPPRAPDRVLMESLAAVETTGQRHVFVRMPWRMRIMTNTAKLAIAVVAVVALGAIGLAVLRPSSSTTPGGPLVTPSGPAPSSGGSSAPSSPPALTKAFVSPVNGYSMSYPADWKVTAATRTWPSGTTPAGPDDPTVDAFGGPSTSIYVVSQKLPVGMTPERWTQAYAQNLDLDSSRLPECTIPKSEPIVVDGVSGVLDVTCPSAVIDALLVTGGRAYDLSLIGDPPDKTLLLDVLKTVKLHPADAIDASPSAIPSGAPSPSP